MLDRSYTIKLRRAGALQTRILFGMNVNKRPLTDTCKRYGYLCWHTCEQQLQEVAIVRSRTVIDYYIVFRMSSARGLARHLRVIDHSSLPAPGPYAFGGLFSAFAGPVAATTSKIDWQRYKKGRLFYSQYHCHCWCSRGSCRIVFYFYVLFALRLFSNHYITHQHVST